MSRRSRRFLALGAALLAALVGILVVAPEDAWARVGGGGSYGGGGRGRSGGGGGGGGGELVYVLIRLLIMHPKIGVPVVLFFVGYYVVSKSIEARSAPPQSTQDAYQDLVSGRSGGRRRGLRAQLDALLQDDPNFSEILFLDFAQLLYTRFQEARGGRDPVGLLPYLSPELGARLRAAGPAVEEVIVGSVTVGRVARQGGSWRIEVEIEANYVEVGPGGRNAWFSRARLQLRRQAGQLSRGPDDIGRLGCPSCGSPVRDDALDACAHCGGSLRSGLFHWELAALTELERLPRVQAPLGLGGEEQGTDFPTLFDPELGAGIRSFRARCPDDSLERLQGRARAIFLALQAAWTEGRWEQARALETDRLFQMHRFWMDRYAARGWRNVLEDVRVAGLELVKLDRDAFFEHATFRIHASMVDCTLDRDGKLVDGQRGRARRFSEYWTFVRRAGFVPKQDVDTEHCPSCGAPLQIGADGLCTYCHAQLSSARFDWTLAKIEQDEAYRG